MSFKWKTTSDEIARVISKKNIGGIFSKSITIAPNQKAAIIKNGVVEETVSSGKLRVGGLLKGEINKDVDIALMDISPKDLQWASSEMWTSDNQKISCKGLLRFKIYDEQKFFQMLFAYTTQESNGERKLSVQDIYNRLESETITRVLQPEIRNIGIENIYGNREMQLRLENELEMQLKSTFAMWGLELIRYSVEWDLGTYEQVMQASNEFHTNEELKELETLSKEGDIGRQSREQIAQTRAGLAPESVIRDHERNEGIKQAKHGAAISQIESESDALEAKQAIDTFRAWKETKNDLKRSEFEIEEDMEDRKYARDKDYMNNIMDKGGADTAKIIAQGREFGSMSPAQIEALSKIQEAEASKNEDRIKFMMDVEDRERADAYRHKELDAAMMGAAQNNVSPGVRKCPNCGSVIAAEANFCGQCGSKMQ
jgi:hypothetical protein